MAKTYNNHLIDPSYFYDAIEEFAFNYDWYVQTKPKIDDEGKLNIDFDLQTIRGSLQSLGKTLNQSATGNTETMTYSFYCKSLYRVNIGDFLNYKDKWLHVDTVKDYDEFGVRECGLTSVELTDYHDLNEYVRYLKGEEIV